MDHDLSQAVEARRAPCSDREPMGMTPSWPQAVETTPSRSDAQARLMRLAENLRRQGYELVFDDAADEAHVEVTALVGRLRHLPPARQRLVRDGGGTAIVAYRKTAVLPPSGEDELDWLLDHVAQHEAVAELLGETAADLPALVGLVGDDERASALHRDQRWLAAGQRRYLPTAWQPIDGRDGGAVLLDDDERLLFAEHAALRQYLRAADAGADFTRLARLAARVAAAQPLAPSLLAQAAVARVQARSRPPTLDELRLDHARRARCEGATSPGALCNPYWSE